MRFKFKPRVNISQRIVVPVIKGAVPIRVRRMGSVEAIWAEPRVRLPNFLGSELGPTFVGLERVLAEVPNQRGLEVRSLGTRESRPVGTRSRVADRI